MPPWRAYDLRAVNDAASSELRRCPTSVSISRSCHRVGVRQRRHLPYVSAFAHMTLAPGVPGGFGELTSALERQREWPPAITATMPRSTHARWAPSVLPANSMLSRHNRRVVHGEAEHRPPRGRRRSLLLGPSHVARGDFRRPPEAGARHGALVGARSYRGVNCRPRLRPPTSNTDAFAQVHRRGHGVRSSHASADVRE